MSDPRKQVHQQSNGARIVVATRPPDDDPPSEPSEVDERPARRRPPPRSRGAAPSARPSAQATYAGASSARGWAPALVLGGLVTVLCTFLYNVVVMATYSGFLFYRLIALVSGSLIGYAVQTGDPPGQPIVRRLVAMGLTYLCVASTFTWAFYDQVVHPEHWEVYEVEDVFADIWDTDGGGSVAPEPVAAAEEPAPIQSLDATSGPALPSVGIETWAVFVAIFKSLALVFVLLAEGDRYGFLVLALALGQAFKFAAPGWK